MTRAEPSHVLAVADERRRRRWIERSLASDGTIVTFATAETAPESLDGSVDCVVYDAGRTFDAALCHAVCERAPTLSLLVVVDEATEAVVRASAALGFTHVPRELATEQLRTLVEASCRREVDSALFEAAFEDNAFRWVLDDDGTVVRMNDRASAALDDDAASALGSPWWDGAWWTAGDAQELRARVRRANAGETATHETSARVSSTGRATVEVTVTPAGSNRLLATAVDVSTRSQLAKRLRRSEELHRVTLNNMTDTVLVTDDDGRFTYVCPNVHFIFGYTVDEIEAMGTIDELLGSKLFDPDELDERGVLTNIECVTTDSDGAAHTLLVNVKRVTIQDGTTLYSCRDITTRKRRERALSALHDVANELLYAETGDEIAELVVDRATEIPRFDAVAVYLYDSTENLLRPAAATEEMRRQYGPLRPVTPGSSRLGRAFLEEVSVDIDRFESGDSAVCIPLGDHAVFVVGSTDDGLDETTREVAALLATTTAAALDRVARETRLRERDERLREQNEQLARANRINDLIREVDQAVIGAESRAEIEQAVCQRLVGSDRFAFAWVGERAVGGDSVRPRVWEGRERGYLTRAIETDAPVDADEPSVKTASTGEPTFVRNVAEEPRAAPWRTVALSCEFQSVGSVPLVSDGVVHGTLAVYADSAAAFDDTTESVLTELGETVGSAISAAARKDALLNESVTELEYTVDRETGALGTLARRADCTLTLDGVIQRDDDVLAFVTADGTTGERLVEIAAGLSSIEAVRVVTDEDPSVVQLRLSTPFLATVLADHGAVLSSFVVEPDGCRLVVRVSPSVATRSVDALVREQYPNANLRAQRERTHPTGRVRLGELLTDRQLEVVRTAYYAGYFDSPRASNGEAVAETLEITPQAFYQHVRAAERRVYDAILSEPESVVVEL